jgi:hypothetical protein
MLYEDQARELANAINQNWRRLSMMSVDQREAALASICHDILRFGSAGFTTPFTLTQIDIESMIKKMLKNQSPRDPNEPY